MKARLLLLSAILMFAAGCGGGSSSTPPSGSVAGNWQMNLQKTSAPKLPIKTQSGFLAQAKNDVSGSLLLRATGCSGVGDVSGTISGSNVALVENLSGVTVNLTGTLGSDQTSMSGDYTILSHGCFGPQTAPEIGTFTGTLVPALKGSFQATYTSHKLGLLPAAAGMVSQSDGTGTSAPLSGSFDAFSGYCFGATSFTGVASGTTVAMNLNQANPDGTTSQVATVTGTSYAGKCVGGTKDTLSCNTITAATDCPGTGATCQLGSASVVGQLSVVPHAMGVNPPCVDGDAGTISLSF
jgi:hypothetical protein